MLNNMASLSLCAISSFAYWVLHDKTQIIDHVSWSDENSRSLSDQLKDQLEALLKNNNLLIDQIKDLSVFTGPGAFTSLRMSVAFALGLSKSLNITLKGIPSYYLFSRSFWIPTRHQLVRHMSFEECLEARMEFLEVLSPTESSLSIPQTKDFTLGTKESAHWPTTDLIMEAIKVTQHLPSLKEKIEINYGLNPKISGQRQP